MYRSKKMYRLSKDDVKLLNNLLLMKDLNPEDGYSKEKVIEYVKADRELNEAELNQIRNYVLDKNLEYRFKENDEPNELGYATEELGDKLYYIILWKKKVINRCLCFLFGSIYYMILIEGGLFRRVLTS